MAKIDVQRINKNRRLMENSTIDSPYCPQIEDCDADYGEQLYGNMPPDKVGFLPANEKNRSKE
jgi:hypothetical protein